MNSPAIRGATHGCPLTGTSSINIKIEIFSTVPVGMLSEGWGISGQAALVAQAQSPHPQFILQTVTYPEPLKKKPSIKE